MICRVRHVTQYRYATPVELAMHQLRLSPRALPGQRVLDAAILTDPPAAHRRDGCDHFGNPTTWLSIETPHDRFEVIGTATVEVRMPDPPPPAETPPWEAVAQAATAVAAAEFLHASPLVPETPAAAAWARVDFPAGRPVLEAVLAFNRRLCDEIAFRPGVTAVGTPPAEVLERREGVCQDVAQLMLAGLRGLGLPARYVSGYLRTRPPPGQPRRRGADASHAWVGCWLGPAVGWVDLDPTNGLIVHEEHVVLAWGRDYGDVGPVRGVVLGGGAHTLEVAVDLEPLQALVEA